MKHLFRALSLALALFIGTAPQGQAGPSCGVPPRLPATQPERVPQNEVRIVPITGYLLSLSWSPQFCREHGNDPRQATQCRSDPPFGFILHGLWPEGEGRDDPAWCQPARLLSATETRTNFCTMPSPHLQQHEWAKHGSCMTKDPVRYFKAASSLFRSLRTPDMDHLSRRALTIGDFTAALTSLNSRLPETAVLIRTSGGNWLKEVQFCFGPDFKPRACPDDMGRPQADSPLKIWRAVK
jgi:ribonuclease T2